MKDTSPEWGLLVPHWHRYLHTELPPPVSEAQQPKKKMMESEGLEGRSAVLRLSGRLSLLWKQVLEGFWSGCSSHFCSLRFVWVICLNLGHSTPIPPSVFTCNNPKDFHILNCHRWQLSHLSTLDSKWADCIVAVCALMTPFFLRTTDQWMLCCEVALGEKHHFCCPKYLLGSHWLQSCPI